MVRSRLVVLAFFVLSALPQLASARTGPEPPGTFPSARPYVPAGLHVLGVAPVR